MIPSLGITVTETVRSGLGIVMHGVPCPTCGNTGKGMTLREVAGQVKVSPSTLSRFLNGRSIDSDTLDRLYEWVVPRLGSPDA